jgi:hypothetical protein
VDVDEMLLDKKRAKKGATTVHRRLHPPNQTLKIVEMQVIMAATTYDAGYRWRHHVYTALSTCTAASFEFSPRHPKNRFV